MAKKNKNQDAPETPEEGQAPETEEGPEETQQAAPDKSEKDMSLEELRAKIRRETIEEILASGLSTSKKVFKKGAKSHLEPVHASGSVKDAEASEAELPPEEKELVEIDLDVPVYVNGKEVFGKVICKQHEARSLIQMVHQKKLADYESTIGRSFLAKRLASGKLEIKQVEDLDTELKQARK